MPKATKKGSLASEGIKARGFFRLQIADNGKVVGDSGWKENTVTNLGFEQYLCYSLGTAVGTAKNVAYAMLGSGTAPAATATTLDGEYTDAAAVRCAVTPTTLASKTVQFAFTLASNVYTNAKTIQNVGLINHSSTATLGTIFSGNTYTTSALATNQSVNGSYQIRFA